MLADRTDTDRDTAQQFSFIDMDIHRNMEGYCETYLAGYRAMLLGRVCGMHRE